MSSQTTAFAIEQKQLDPVEQLALIIISDCCGDYFTLMQADNVIRLHTCLDPKQRQQAIDSLIEKHLLFIPISKRNRQVDAEDVYMVMVVQS